MLETDRPEIIEYFKMRGLTEGVSFTYKGLCPPQSGVSEMPGIEFMDGFWRTYVAQASRKTNYQHWRSFEEAAKQIIQQNLRADKS